MQPLIVDDTVDENAQGNAFLIQDLLPYKLYHISAIHERIVYANMSRITNITLPEWRVMGNIASGLVTFTELAEELLLDKGQLSNIIKELENKQLVEKRRSDTDGRKKHLALTPLGETRKRFIINMASRYQEVIEKDLDQEERLALRKALSKVEHNIRSFWNENHG